ncbi:hypothetical protein K0M31_011512 [Melipona bicolor]|uniref:Uncharacterized protein n=1 Tax=Melipona bicolor TaxID=60889 RepID=A0AA40KUV2_9HYME|nr:hypothetical protein K0M31_011512 [Melipona bicolor]
MEKNLFLVWIVCLVLVVTHAKPVPQQDNYDDEVLSPRDTVYYPFWLIRPIYDQDDIGYNTNRRSTISYANVGAGWGR